MTISATYLDLQRVIADELADRTDLLGELADTNLAASPIKRAIQSAIAKWEREPFYFNEEYTQPLFTTVAGQELYTSTDAAALASSPDIWLLHALVSANRYTLTRRDWAYIEDMSPNANLRGQPTEWAYLGNQIRLYPIPDAAYPVRATRTTRFAALMNDADSNVWTTEAFDLIRSEAKAILARDVLHDPDLKLECEEAIYGNPLRSKDKGYYGALRTETMRRGRTRIRPTQF
jgi:hypothetical protein